MGILFGDDAAAPAEDEGEPIGEAEELYEILCEQLAELPAGKQMEIGLALQRGTDWAELPPHIRELFEGVTREFLPPEADA